jgi:hypothetical protein
MDQEAKFIGRMIEKSEISRKEKWQIIQSNWGRLIHCE